MFTVVSYLIGWECVKLISVLSLQACMTSQYLKTAPHTTAWYVAIHSTLETLFEIPDYRVGAQTIIF